MEQSQSHTYVRMYVCTYVVCLLLAALLLQLVVPGANDNQQFAPAKPERRSSVPQRTAAVDRSTEADKRSSVPHMITGSGLQYALSDKASVKDNHASSDTTEDQGVCINILNYAISIHTYTPAFVQHVFSWSRLINYVCM